MEVTELYYVKKDIGRLAGITAGFELQHSEKIISPGWRLAGLGRTSLMLK